MQKLFVSISVLCIVALLVSFTSAPIVRVATANTSPTGSVVSSTIPVSVALYSSLALETKGLSKEAFDYAYKGYQKLIATNRVRNERYLTVCDFSQSSKSKRLYLIDMEEEKLVMHTWVAHGKNSGVDYAKSFSNTPESLQSSLGFYVTQQTYTGQHGLSLRLQGMEPGFNDKAMERAIVIHGADYIGAQRMGAAYMGRSFGCPAVSQKESGTLINLVKNGSCLFIYHPAKKYLASSKILND